MSEHTCVRSEQNKVCAGPHVTTEAELAERRSYPYPESFTRLSDMLRRRAEQRAKETD